MRYTIAATDEDEAAEGGRRKENGEDMARTSVRAQLYQAARTLGDAEAAAQGPGAYARRVARRHVYRASNRLTLDLLRAGGLAGRRRRRSPWSVL